MSRRHETVQEQEDALTEKLKAKEWLDLAVKAAGLGAWLWELVPGTARIIRSEKYNSIVGIKPGLIPWTIDDQLSVIHPEDRPLVETSMAAVFSGSREEYDAEYRIVRKDGTVCWVHSMGRGFPDLNGRVVRVAGVIREINERKKLEQDREQFIKTLTHDLRNPLAAAQANAELLLNYPEQVKDHDGMLKKIIMSAERADGLIQDLLDVSRVKAGRPMHLILVTCDLKAVLLDAFEELITVHGDRFKFISSGEFQGLWGCDGLRRVLENLVDNAIKYGAPDKPVTVTLSQFGESAELAVHNEGNPISVLDQQQLFEPFNRTVTAERSGKKGWGMGLTLVKSIAESLGGRARVESGPDIGTTFRVEFPIKAVGVSGEFSKAG